ncbi:MAG TPA: GNAT family protein [Roseiflexaceae bacterium]|nr:GNAT family protein [Roseiflexaceae bacterium]
MSNDQKQPVICGERVGLRPVIQSDIVVLDSWTNDAAINGSYNMFGLEPMNGHGSGFQARGLLEDQQGTLMIVTLAGEIVGGMSYHEVRYGPNAGSRAYNIGLHINPEHRGKGYGSEAQRLMAEYLLQTFPIARVEAETDITNIPEQRALEKAGFAREGVLRKAQWRAGDWHDLVVYSRVRGD